MVEKLILIIIGQAMLGIGAVIKMWFSHERVKERLKIVEDCNEKLLDKISAMSEDMAVIKSHFELGTLKGIKTHSR